MHKYKSNFTLIKTNSLSLTHAHTYTYRVMQGLVECFYHRRASGVLGMSKFWLGGLKESSHTPRKATAVSLSSISSAAVASIFSWEKLLMGSPSTIFQVLSLIWTGNE